VGNAVLSLTVLLIKTLSDDRRLHMQKLHEKHQGDTLSDAPTGNANRRAFDYELDRRISE